MQVGLQSAVMRSGVVRVNPSRKLVPPVLRPEVSWTVCGTFAAHAGMAASPSKRANATRWRRGDGAATTNADCTADSPEQDGTTERREKSERRDDAVRDLAALEFSYASFEGGYLHPWCSTRI